MHTHTHTHTHAGTTCADGFVYVTQIEVVPVKALTYDLTGRLRIQHSSPRSTATVHSNLLLACIQSSSMLQVQVFMIWIPPARQWGNLRHGCWYLSGRQSVCFGPTTAEVLMHGDSYPPAQGLASYGAGLGYFNSEELRPAHFGIMRKCTQRHGNWYPSARRLGSY